MQEASVIVKDIILKAFRYRFLQYFRQFLCFLLALGFLECLKKQLVRLFPRFSIWFPFRSSQM